MTRRIVRLLASLAAILLAWLVLVQPISAGAATAQPGATPVPTSCAHADRPADVSTERGTPTDTCTTTTYDAVDRWAYVSSARPEIDDTRALRTHTRAAARWQAGGPTATTREQVRRTCGEFSSSSTSQVAAKTVDVAASRVKLRVGTKAQTTGCLRRETDYGPRIYWFHRCVSCPASHVSSAWEIRVELTCVPGTSRSRRIA